MGLNKTQKRGKRYIVRFPEDFMFELTGEEFINWRSQFVTSNKDKMGLRYTPFAFTEDGRGSDRVTSLQPDYHLFVQSHPVT